jgi:hypothetical protein
MSLEFSMEKYPGHVLMGQSPVPVYTSMNLMESEQISINLDW